MKAAGTRASRSLRVPGATVGQADDHFPEGLITPTSPIWDSTLQKTNEWLKALGRELGTSTGSRQLLAFRCVLHALRDRLQADEAAELAAQFPLLLKGVYFDGWRPSATPLKARTMEEFLALVLRPLPLGTPQEEAERFTRAVFTVLAERVSIGEVRDVLGMLPAELKVLWPERLAAV